VTTTTAATDAGQPFSLAMNRVRRAYAAVAEVDRPEIWIALRPEADVLREASLLDERSAAGERLPLAGRLLAVKDNIDVVGLPTTAGCPAYSYLPTQSAPAVSRLVRAGALVLGKANLDQFATGLVGTRSPYGAVRNAWRPERISGGSSSGSAVAVALGLVDLGIGTDTAGSGRIPAALQGIVGIKPTPGLIPTTGVVPAAPSYDCVSVFARTIGAAEEAVGIMAGPDAVDPRCTARPPDAPLAAGTEPLLAVPDPARLPGLDPAWVEAFAAACRRATDVGMRVVTIDLSAFLEAAALLYDGALVAERYSAVGAFIDTHPDSIDPTVRQIVQSAGTLSAHQLVSDRHRVATLRQAAMLALGEADALLVPTAPEHPTLEAVAEDPRGVNTRLGRYTNFANLFGLTAVAVPAGTVDDGPFGVTVLARGFADRVACDIARQLADPMHCGAPVPEPGGEPLLVIGAHLRGQPLHHELTALGARFDRAVQTAPHYRLFALSTRPAKPGMTYVGPDSDGVSVSGELFRIPTASLGVLLSHLPPPMTLGPVRLDDGYTVTGFLCQLVAAEQPRDISDVGSWSHYLRQAALPWHGAHRRAPPRRS